MARKFEFKTVPFTDDDGGDLDYRQQLLVILRQAPDPRAGMTFETMEKRYPLIERIKAAEKSIVLEEAEWEECCAAFRAFRFPAFLEGAHRMGKDLLGAPEVEIEAKEPAKG